jgi:hypothetical protein
MRRSIFESVGGYRESLRLSEDFDLWCRMAEVTEIANCDKILGRYRVHESAMSTAHPIRLAITDTCIIAASRARELRQPEPFISGRPSLRAALKILDMRREELRYRILKTMIAIARLALARGDAELAKRLRARVRSQILKLPFRTAWRASALLLASYFRSQTRDRRKVALRRLLPRQGRGNGPAVLD